jgi:hypothetical protein
MTERNPHPDNELIRRMQDEATPAQQSRAGGEMARRIGTRDELDRALGAEDGSTPITGSDNPAQDRLKGDKTLAELQRERDAS